jgi:hypothetical protein
MKIKTYSLISLMTLTLLVAGQAAAQQLHPKLEKKEKAVKTVLLLPAKVELTKSGMKGGEGMLKESEQVAEALPKLIIAALQKKGYTVIEDPFTPQALSENNDLKFALADIQNRYDVMGQQLHRKPKDVKKGRYTMGDEVSKINPDGKADTLVFVRASGNKNTGGKKAFGLLLGNAAMVVDVMLVSISLVDAQTGEVLATTRAAGTGDFVNQTDSRLGKNIEKSLKKLPATAK